MQFLLGCVFGTTITSLIYGIMKVRKERKERKENNKNE